MTKFGLDFEEVYNTEKLKDIVSIDVINNRLYIDVTKPVDISSLVSYMENQWYIRSDLIVFKFPIDTVRFGEYIFDFGAYFTYNTFKNLRVGGVTYGHDKYYCIRCMSYDTTTIYISDKLYKPMTLLKLEKVNDIKLRIHKDKRFTPIEAYGYSIGPIKPKLHIIP